MQLQSFPYSYMESNKPAQIESSQYLKEMKIKQTASCMLTLCAVLPYILAQKIPEDDAKFKCFLLLLDITYICTSPCVTMESVADLRHLVTQHHSSFMREYPKSRITPKQHYLLHMPDQMAQFGPLRNHWAMRFEAKHAYFKSFHWKNFKNIPKSLVSKHQKWLCGQMLSPAGGPAENYLYEGDYVGPGEEIFANHLNAMKKDVLQEKFPEATVLYHAQELTIHGCTYKQGCLVIMDYDDDAFPIFGLVDGIYVCGNEKCLLVQKVEITGYIEAARAYEIEIRDQFSCTQYAKLCVKLPLPVHFYNGRACVINKFSILQGCFSAIGLICTCQRSKPEAYGYNWSLCYHYKVSMNSGIWIILVWTVYIYMYHALQGRKNSSCCICLVSSW